MAYGTEPADKAKAVTTSNTANLSPNARALYVGVAGDVKVDVPGSATAVTFVGVAAGTILPVQVQRVYATGTTATNIIALN